MLLFLPIVFIILRATHKIWSIWHTKIGKVDNELKRNLLIVFGSGGHTTEMLMIFKDYDFQTRCDTIYMIRAHTDTNSENRVK